MYVVDIGAIAVLPTVAPLPHAFEGTGVIWRITKEGAGPTTRPGNLSPLSIPSKNESARAMP